MIRATFKSCCILMTLLIASCGEMPSRSVTALPDDLLRFQDKGQPRGVARSNLDLAQDFLDLTFALENGETLPSLLKYDGPVRVVLRSQGLSQYQPEVSALLRRIRREAGVDIRQTDDPEEAQIHVHAVPRQTISRAFPGAACFIVPGVRSWNEFRNPAGRENQILWSRQSRLSITSIFLPADSTPQDTRDCLHEELGQALGPANDLYRVPDTIFNDDNFHSVLTPFDMLMLKTLYDPALTNGLSRGEVAVRLPSILDRINPSGRSQPPAARAPASKAWKSAIEIALNRSKSRSRRLRAARQAVSLASAMQPADHRLGLSLLTQGRILARNEPARAAELFRGAYAQFTGQFGTNDIRATHVALHLALFALKNKQFDTALSLTELHIPTARRSENAVVLSGLLAIKAETLLAIGNIGPAREARIESLAWARYAFGDRDGAIARAQAEIAAFNPNRTGVEQ